jgi:serine protease Do
MIGRYSVKTVAAFLAALLLAIPAHAQVNGWIGVSIQEQPDRGVLIRSVEADSPAERAGLKANDVILQFNKQDVIGVAQLTRLVNETPVGRSVDITVRRENREQTFKVTSEQAPLLSRFRIQSPGVNFESLRDNISQKLQPFQIITTASATQLGIQANTLTPQLREFFGVKGSDGVLVASVQTDSVAARAGLMAGDVITAIDGRSVSNTADFSREMRSRGQSFTIRIVRNKQDREIKVER